MTAGTPLYVLFDELSESWALVGFSYEFPGVRNSGVSCSRGVMKVFEDLASKVEVVLQVDFARKKIVGQQDAGFVSIHPLIKV